MPPPAGGLTDRDTSAPTFDLPTFDLPTFDLPACSLPARCTQAQLPPDDRRC